MELLHTIGNWALSVLGGILFALHPWAALGGLTGLCWFLAVPRATTRGQRRLLGMFSVLAGYAAGVYLHPDGPPWSPQAMLPAGIVSTFGVVIATALSHMVNNAADLPKWLQTLLDFVPFLNRKGP